MGQTATKLGKKKTKRRTRARTKSTFEADLLFVLSHPLRARALAILNERVASPKEIAKELGETVGNLSYHVRVLWEYDFAELVDEARRRGATEHFYRATSRTFLDDETWAKMSPETKEGLSVATLKMINDTAKAALEAKTFDSRSDRHLSCTPVAVDEEGWTEITEAMCEALERVIAAQTATVERRAEAEGGSTDTIRATVSLISCESPPVRKREESPEGTG